MDVHNLTNIMMNVYFFQYIVIIKGAMTKIFVYIHLIYRLFTYTAKLYSRKLYQYISLPEIYEIVHFSATSPTSGIIKIITSPNFHLLNAVLNLHLISIFILLWISMSLSFVRFLQGCLCFSYQFTRFLLHCKDINVYVCVVNNFLCILPFNS